MKKFIFGLLILACSAFASEIVVQQGNVNQNSMSSGSGAISAASDGSLTVSGSVMFPFGVIGSGAVWEDSDGLGDGAWATLTTASITGLNTNLFLRTNDARAVTITGALTDSGGFIGNLTGTASLATSAGTVTGSVGGSVNLPAAQITGSIASNALPGNIVYTNGSNTNIYVNLNITNATAATGVSLGTNGQVTCQNIKATNLVAITTTSDNAAAGFLGEFTNSLVAVGSAIALTTTVVSNVTSISLTGGDWDVEGNVNYSSGTATVTGKVAAISSTSATLPTDGSEVPNGTQMTLISAKDGTSLPRKRISLSTTTTIYLVAQATFSAGSISAYGQISARRVR